MHALVRGALTEQRVPKPERNLVEIHTFNPGYGAKIASEPSPSAESVHDEVR